MWDADFIAANCWFMQRWICFCIIWICFIGTQPPVAYSITLSFKIFMTKCLLKVPVDKSYFGQSRTRDFTYLLYNIGLNLITSIRFNGAPPCSWVFALICEGFIRVNGLEKKCYHWWIPFSMASKMDPCVRKIVFPSLDW